MIRSLYKSSNHSATDLKSWPMGWLQANDSDDLYSSFLIVDNIRTLLSVLFTDHTNDKENDKELAANSELI